MDATNPPPSFADWLREQMIACGYQMDGPRAGGLSLLARQANVHRSTISRIFTKDAVPKQPALEAIAAALGIPKTEILIAAGIVRRDELPTDNVPAAPLGTETFPEPNPSDVLSGGLRDENERTIWAMTAVRWPARRAAIQAMREEARRLATENVPTPRSTRRPA